MPIGATRIFHINVNCSDLERSLRFYRDLLGLEATAHTYPQPQPGGAFGLDTAQWDAWILADGRGLDAGVAVDLLEWQVPRPTGRPYPSVANLGFGRLCLLTTDVEAAHTRLTAAGVDCWSPPASFELGVEGMAPVRAFVCSDPDGTAVQLVQGDAGRLVHVNVNCSDLERSRSFYVDVVGLRPTARSNPGPQDGRPFRLGDQVEWDAWFLEDPRGDAVFFVDLVEWKRPTPTGAPYDVANHLGMYRMALLTDDLDRDYEALRHDGVRSVTPPADLDMGPGLPHLRALLFPDPDGTMLELIEAPAAG